MSLIRYIYKENTYIVKGKTMMKDPTSRKWLPAILYHKVGEPDKLYTREEKEFVALFAQKTVGIEPFNSKK